MTENFVKDRQTEENSSSPSPSDRGYNEEIEYTKNQDICEPMLTNYTLALLI